MITLNLVAANEGETKIKNYLENNVSEILAEKINNGIRIVKDDKTLINKKTIATFMKYASEEAKKLAEKGARFAMVEDTTVFGWAIHFWEEDTIEGVLFNEDGTEYKSPAPVVAPMTEVKPKAPEPPKPQNMSLFDLVGVA